MRYTSKVFAASMFVTAGGGLLACGEGSAKIGSDDAPASTAGTSAVSSESPATEMQSTAAKPSVATTPAGNVGAPSKPAANAPATGAMPAATAGAPAVPNGAPTASAPTATAGAPATVAGSPAAASGTAGTPASTSGTGSGAGSCGPAVDIAPEMLGAQAPMSGGGTVFANLGPWKPMHVENTGPTGASWIFYPEDFGKDGMKHPVFLWGPGASTGPSNYKGYLDLLASHGIVTICQASTNSGTQALDWFLKENEATGSMWYGKLDPDRVARGGHSMGALLSLSEAKDDRLKATILVCGGSGGGGGGADITYPSLFLGATGEGGTTNFQGDYAEVKGPSIFVTRRMSDHVACGRDNMSPWVAFLRWHLCGEEDKYKKEFMSGGTFCMGEWEACMEKNF